MRVFLGHHQIVYVAYMQLFIQKKKSEFFLHQSLKFDNGWGITSYSNHVTHKGVGLFLSFDRPHINV